MNAIQIHQGFPTGQEVTITTYLVFYGYANKFCENQWFRAMHIY